METEKEIFPGNTSVVGFCTPAGVNGYLSNWFDSPFQIAGNTFRTVNQFVFYQKAQFCGRHDLAELILASDGSEQIKSILSDKNCPEQRSIQSHWEGIRKTVTLQGIRAKFLQNSDLADKLQKTGDALLCKCDAEDSTGGIGLGIRSKLWHDPSNWKGANRTGKLLMQFRTELLEQLAQEGRVEYNDYSDAEPQDYWKRKASEVSQFPEFSAAVKCYADRLDSEERDRFFSGTFTAWEKLVCEESARRDGFFEMKQAVYETTVRKRRMEKHVNVIRSGKATADGIIIDSIDRMLEEIEKLRSGLKNESGEDTDSISGRLWFRGHGDVEWELVPSVQRMKGYTDGDYPPERSMTNAFRMRAAQILPEPPAKDNYSAWVSLMQHYGLPTRLLDWSKSPLIAAFFATERYDDSVLKEKDACIWVLQPSLLNYKMIESPSILPCDSRTVEEMLQRSFKRESRDSMQYRRSMEESGRKKIVACCAVENNLRMYSQQACFTVHDTKESLIDFNEDGKFLTRFVIPASCKKAFHDALRIFGISESFIYPDMDHISKDVKRAYQDYMK